MLFTYLVLGLLIFISWACSGGLFYLRHYLADDPWKGKTEIVWAVLICSLAQGIVTFILFLLFKPIILWLTKFENHKTRV